MKEYYDRRAPEYDDFYRSADARVRARVRAQVDALLSDRDAGDERVRERVVLSDEGEDAAVVVGVDVQVENAGVLLERGADGDDRRPVAALREVRHRLERQHLAYPRPR